MFQVNEQRKVSVCCASFLLHKTGATSGRNGNKHITTCSLRALLCLRSVHTLRLGCHVLCTTVSNRSCDILPTGSAIYSCWKLENNFVCSGSLEAGRLWPRPQEKQVHDIYLPGTGIFYTAVVVHCKRETRFDLLGAPSTKQNGQLPPDH